MTSIRNMALDESVTRYMRESEAAKKERLREFVKPAGTSTGVDLDRTDATRKLRKASVRGAKQKARRPVEDASSDFRPLVNLELQCRGWLGLHERGLTGEGRVRVIRKLLTSTGLGAVVLISLVCMGTQKVTPAPVSEQPTTQSAGR